MGEPTWQSDQFDFDAYTARIGYTGPLEPTPGVLRELHTTHLAAIPFENLEIVLGRGIPLDAASLQAKLVGSRRGGYCFEQNLLLAAALEHIGFDVEGLGARVRLGAGKLLPATHALLRVRIEDESWITDVGFGAFCVLTPLPLRDGAAATVGGFGFRLGRAGGGWMLYGSEPMSGGQETDLYSFDESPRLPVDYEVGNYYTSTHPRSPFTGRVVVQRAAPGRRSRLLGDEFIVDRPDGRRETRRVAPEETPELLAAEFGIRLEAADAAALVDFQRAAA
jgi:N-hydroxyarylamine O-acetyltransferase